MLLSSTAFINLDAILPSSLSMAPLPIDIYEHSSKLLTKLKSYYYGETGTSLYLSCNDTNNSYKLKDEAADQDHPLVWRKRLSVETILLSSLHRADA